MEFLLFSPLNCKLTFPTTPLKQVMVSVIIPVFNRRELLQRAIESVSRQSTEGLEIIVVDDHSTDDIESICNHLHCRYLRNSGRGVSAARNTGIAAAKFSYLAFLDSDDEWLPEKIEVQLQYMKERPHLQLSHTNETWMRHGKEVPQKAKHKRSGGKIFEHCAELCVISPSTVMAHRSLFNEIGFFDEDFPVCEDFDLWLRVTSDREVGFIEMSLTVKHGGHSDQLSLKHHSMDLWRVRALAKHIGHPLLAPHETHALERSLKSKAEILLMGFKKYPNPDAQREVESYLVSIGERSFI